MNKIISVLLILFAALAITGCEVKKVADLAAIAKPWKLDRCIR